jgi:hypothetical protein
MEIEEVLKNALQDRVRRFRKNPNLVLDFENGALSQDVATDDQARGVVTDATVSAADHFGRKLNTEGRQTIRGSISTDTGYGTAVAVMDEAISNGSDPKVSIG